MSGLVTFTNILKSHPEGLKLLDNYSFLLAARKEVIGADLGKVSKVIHRVDGLWYQCFTGHDWIDWKINFYLCNKNLFDNVRRSDALVFQSRFSLAQFEQLFGPRGLSLLSCRQYTIIYNGSDFQSRVTPQNLASGETLKLISSGVLHPCKRFHYFFELSRLLEINQIKSEITLCLGSVNSFQSLVYERLNFQKFAAAFNSQSKYCQLIILRDIGRFDLESRLKSSHVFVSFSNRDPCPNSVIEALRVGIPVIGPKSGGIAELIDPHCQFDSDSDIINFFNWLAYEQVNNAEVLSCFYRLMEICSKYPYYSLQAHLDSVEWTSSRMLESYKNFCFSI